ncbi:hypothetical protein ACUOCP_58755, partial [Escherichia sp. R-CC3]
ITPASFSGRCSSLIINSGMLMMYRLFLPSMQKELPLATGTIEAPRRNRRDTLLLFVICTLMWGSNSL